MDKLRARIDYILKHNHGVYLFFNAVVSWLLRLWGILIPIDKRLIVFTAHSRKYNDSPKVLYEFMINHPEMYGSYNCVWGLEDPQNTVIPGNPIKIKSDSIEYFRYTLKAKYWITCVNIERGLHYKKDSCRYLNTWHGTPFKHVGNDAGSRKDFDFSNIDYFCYSGVFEKVVFQRAFNLREEALIPTGLPRNDELYHVTMEEINSIKTKLILPLDKKVILYAPTWRDSLDIGNTYAIKPPISVTKWVQALSDEYIVLFRTHSYTNKLLGICFNDVIRDFSSYSNVNDLFKVADILISDYSAAMSDFAILERPILCFAYDYDAYRNDRGLYFDYATEMPSGILRTEDAVLDYIKTMNYKDECRKTKELIKDRLIQFGGNATEQCLNKLLGE